MKNMKAEEEEIIYHFSQTCACILQTNKTQNWMWEYFLADKKLNFFDYMQPHTTAVLNEYLNASGVT